MTGDGDKKDKTASSERPRAKNMNQQESREKNDGGVKEGTRQHGNHRATKKDDIKSTQNTKTKAQRHNGIGTLGSTSFSTENDKSERERKKLMTDAPKNDCIKTDGSNQRENGK